MRFKANSRTATRPRRTLFNSSDRVLIRPLLRERSKGVTILLQKSRWHSENRSITHNLATRGGTLRHHSLGAADPATEAQRLARTGRMWDCFRPRSLQIFPMDSAEGIDPLLGQAREFNTTHWSVVLQAADAHSPLADSAMEQLCRHYWYPLYVYARRLGRSRTMLRT